MIHLAGPAITFDGYRRQRCLWCGTPIIDENLALIAMPIAQLEEARAKGHDPHPSWKDGAFIEIEGENPRCFSVVEPDIDPDDDERVIVPKDCCMRLPPELTGANRG